MELYAYFKFQAFKKFTHYNNIQDDLFGIKEEEFLYKLFENKLRNKCKIIYCNVKCVVIVLSKPNN